MGGKGEGWMIERGGDLPIWDGKGYQSGSRGADYPRDERRRAGAGGRVCGRRLHYKWNGYRTLYSNSSAARVSPIKGGGNGVGLLSEG